MVIQCNPFVANPPIFEIVGDPSPNPPLVDAPEWDSSRYDKNSDNDIWPVNPNRNYVYVHFLCH